MGRGGGGTATPQEIEPVAPLNGVFENESGGSRSFGTTGVMFDPRRLLTARPSSVETIARKPSHFSSKDHAEPEGSGPGRDSFGSGSRRTSSRLVLAMSEDQISR